MGRFCDDDGLHMTTMHEASLQRNRHDWQLLYPIPFENQDQYRDFLTISKQITLLYRHCFIYKQIAL